MVHIYPFYGPNSSLPCVCYSNLQHPGAGGFETHPQPNSPALWLLAMATQQSQDYEQHESSSRPMEAGVTVIMVEETLRPQLLQIQIQIQIKHSWNRRTHMVYVMTQNIVDLEWITWMVDLRWLGFWCCSRRLESWSRSVPKAWAVVRPNTVTPSSLNKGP